MVSFRAHLAGGICLLLALNSSGVASTNIAPFLEAQAGLREAGVLLRGADDISAWLCAASAFLALAQTFRRGELIRVGLWIERLKPVTRHRAEIVALLIATVCVGYMTWAVTCFVYESWKFNEVAQGLIKVPIWIPQSTLVIGLVIFLIAVLDELYTVLRGGEPEYRLAEERRAKSGDFSESL